MISGTVEANLQIELRHVAGLSEGLIQEMNEGVEKAKDSAILQQLASLIDRKILVIKESEPFVAADKDVMSGNTILKVPQYICIELHNEEYVKKLEQENIELKSKLDDIRRAIEVSQ